MHCTWLLYILNVYNVEIKVGLDGSQNEIVQHAKSSKPVQNSNAAE